MLAADHSIQLSRAHIADLHAQANRRRLARSVTNHPKRPAAALRQLAATAVLVAVPVLVPVLETAGPHHP
jgi:hypothetical protein